MPETRAALSAVMPTFGLRVRWDDLELRLPDDVELLALAGLAGKGHAVIENSYRMTRELWDARPDDLRPEIALAGVSAVRRLLGIDPLEATR